MSTLGTLVAGVAHEINNPTSFIYGNLHYANEYIKDLLELIRLYQRYYPEPVPEIKAHARAVELEFLIEDLPKVLSSMETGAERIRHLVLSLRNFSRLDQGQVQPVDIHEGLDSTLLILHHRLKANGEHPCIRVIKDYGELPLIECYPSQLNQVFMNLLSNAIDALEEVQDNSKKTKTNFSPVIQISTEYSSPTHIAVRIKDNGSGIKEEVKAQLFDPFFTTKPIGKGTGLGLSISYQIVVDKHKGTLACDSVPGEGTEFSIEIPLKQSYDIKANASASVAVN
jgi:urea transport system substrate-binding protein